jgi:hypothetical protein
MKCSFFCFFIFLCSLVKTQPKQEYGPHFAFGDSAKVTIQVKHCTSRIKCTIHPEYIFPVWSIVPDGRVLDKNSQTSFWLTVEYPIRFSLTMLSEYGDSLLLFTNCLILPGDSLIICADFQNPKDSVLSFSGVTSAICNYYHDLANNRYVSEIIQKAQSPPGRNWYNSISKADSMVLVENDFLSKYIKNQILPEWFVVFERERIGYTGAKEKLGYVRYNNTFRARKIYMSPELFVSLGDVKIDNPDAIYLPEYYDFLTRYFSLIVEPNTSSSLKDFKLRMLFKSLNLIFSELKSEAFDFYIGNTISELFNKVSYSIGVDSILCRVKNHFVQESFYHFLVNQKEYFYKKQLDHIDCTAPTIGRDAPSFILWDSLDAKYYLNSFKGKNVLIHFWSSRDEIAIPTLDTIHVRFCAVSDTNSILIHICVDPYLDLWENIIRKTKGKDFQLIPKGNNIPMLFDDFGITKMPFFVIIDDRQKLVYRKSSLFEALQTFKNIK